MKKTLLLNYSYQYNAIISERHAIKLIFKNKADIISTWDDYKINWINNSILQFPAILKLKTPYKQFFKSSRSYYFSRDAIIKRDNNTCQYCSAILVKNQITIDHIIPKYHGGKSNFYNCIVACKQCNALKANKLLEESGLKLIRQPEIPKNFMQINIDESLWHKDWKMFLNP